MEEVDLLTKKEFESVQKEALELLKIIRSSILTAKKNNNK